ncbi:hypothetical protein [Rubrobacter calidifluminis]|uniref:hypothetical protein n=1 Tax=Rubrobacter calidifluminis TaxID=1392640 RepID=UPI00235E7076|nr:hypothetical protein [Rubrobacter calidifluminis]
MVGVRGVALVAVVALFFLSACSQRSTGEVPGAPGGTSTISASSAAQVTIRTSSAPAATIRRGDTTSGTTAPARKVTLSIEGDRGVKFSGLCEAGGEETVISGTVPKLFSYRLHGQDLSCKIQKQGGKGALRVTLLVGNTTRSVQQTSAHKGTIHVSYSGGR